MLLYFWMCYKACVRAKVSLFHAKNETVGEKRISHINEAKDYSYLQTPTLNCYNQPTDIEK